MRSLRSLTLIAGTLMSLILIASAALAQVPRVGGERSPRAPTPTSTKPARWYVTDWYDYLAWYGTDCYTVVTVSNLSGQSVSVDVEFIDGLYGIGTYLVTRTVNADDTHWVWSSLRKAALINYPYSASADVADDGGGWVLVAATHPKVIASAVMICSDSAGTNHSAVYSTQSINAVPVGVTLELFKAGLLTQPQDPLGQ